MGESFSLRFPFSPLSLSSSLFPLLLYSWFKGVDKDALGIYNSFTVA